MVLPVIRRQLREGNYEISLLAVLTTSCNVSIRYLLIFASQEIGQYFVPVFGYRGVRGFGTRSKFIADSFEGCRAE